MVRERQFRDAESTSDSARELPIRVASLDGGLPGRLARHLGRGYNRRPMGTLQRFDAKPRPVNIDSEQATQLREWQTVKGFLAFITLVALLVFAMGLVTHASDTGQIINASSNGLVKLFTLELGVVPGTKTTTRAQAR